MQVDHDNFSEMGRHFVNIRMSRDVDVQKYDVYRQHNDLVYFFCAILFPCLVLMPAALFYSILVFFFFQGYLPSVMVRFPVYIV